MTRKSPSAAGARAVPIGDRALSLLVRPISPPLWLGVVVATTLVALESLLVHLLASYAPGNVFGAVFLFGVLVVSAGWGFGLAVTTTVASAIIYFTFHLETTQGGFATVADAAAILIFVPVALLTNLLAGQARLRTAEANHRREEAEASRDELRLLAAQQTALRRIATLVARTAPPAEVFTAVAEELARSLSVQHATLFRDGPSGEATVLAAHGEKCSPDEEQIATTVLRTGRTVRVDREDGTIRSAVGAPIVVAGEGWGAVVAASSQPAPLPPETEARVSDFADLVATAIANAQTRAELTESRARIVRTADDARRRIERDLHDGAQQRLVTLGLQLRTSEAAVPPECPALREQIADAVDTLTGVTEDLREISHGIHPAILSRGGLGPALKTLGRRCAIPVELHLDVERRCPESVEVAAYYVAAEALTNAVKHARASVVTISLHVEAPNLVLSIRDDGIGGADATVGSGLIGLIDRVEALGGRLQVSSVAGAGTSLLATIPVGDTPKSA